MPIVIRELVVKVKVNEASPKQIEKPTTNVAKPATEREHDLIMEAVEQTLKILHNKKER